MNATRGVASVRTVGPDGTESQGSRRNALDVRGVARDVAMIEADGDTARIYVNGVRVESLAEFERLAREHAERTGQSVTS